MRYQWIKKASAAICAISIMLLLLTGCNSAAKNGEATKKMIPDGNAVDLPITADYPEYKTPKDAINQADLAFVGKLVGITETAIDIRLNPSTEATKEDLYPSSIWTFEPADLYKYKYLDPDAKTIRLKVEKTMDGQYEEVPGILIGENYLVLAAEYNGTGDTYLPSLINASQALYTLTSRVDAATVQNRTAPLTADKQATGAGFSAAEVIKILEESKN